MKYFAWSAASVITFLGTLLVACGSSNDSPPSADGGEPPAQDGAPPSAQDSGPPSAADSGSQDAGADAADSGPQDAGADAADSGPRDAGADVTDSATTEDAGPAPLTVKVLRGALPEPGVLVVFQDAVGAIVSTATTGANGSVSQVVAAGSQVTVALGAAQAPNLYTVQVVEPGDTLTFNDVPPLPPAEVVDVTLPAPVWALDAGIYEHVYAGGCSGQPDPYVESQCQKGGQFPLLALAETETGKEVEYTYQKANALLVDGGTPSITIAQPWAPATVSQTVTTSALPPQPGSVGLAYIEAAGGVGTSIVPSSQGAGGSGAAEGTFPVHSGFPDFVQVEASTGGYTLGFLSTVVAVSRFETPTSSQTTSLDLSTLPEITTVVADSTEDAGASVQPTITWTTSGPLTGAAGVIAQFGWTSSATDGGTPIEGGTEYISGTWTIVAPATASSVRAPAMPAGSGWAPAPGSYVNAKGASVAALGGSLVPSYATLRAGLSGIDAFVIGSGGIALLPQNGTLMMSVCFFPGG